MRPRSPFEAADLGVRMCQQHWREVFRCHAVVVLPMIALSIASHSIAAWLPGVLMFLAKPWIDRTTLFVLSRAAFGQRTSVADLWEAQRNVWWGQLLSTWTWRRLSPWRSFTGPVYQLEGLRVGQRARRLRVLRGAYRNHALLMTAAFSFAETLLVVGLAALVIWLVPVETGSAALWARIRDFSGLQEFLLPAGYGLVVLFLEPFYVGAGFTLYLNRRSELEGWDIEQELRRAFPA
jgi:hypothetical protein